MKRTRTIYLALIAVLLSPMVANADLIKLDATSTDLTIADDFSVLFDDTGDGLLQWDEIVSFSGFYSNIWGTTMDSLFQVANTAFSTSTFDPGIGMIWASNWWGFQSSANPSTLYGFSGSIWEYSSTSVPEPSTLALLAVGLLGMGIAGRRKKA